MQKIIRLSVSQIAPIIGLDAYNNFPRITCEIWRKYNPVDFKIFENKLKESGHQLATSNEMNDIWEIDEALGSNILEQVKVLNLNKDKTSGDMVSKQEEIAKYINDNNKFANLDIKEKEELSKKVCSITNKMHGVINEDSILDKFCRLSEKTIKDTQQWVEIPIETLSENTCKWLIVGKYDAITNDNELVEAKMRQKALFKKIRDYENIQIQLYMHALEFQKAYLVESYTNKKGTKQIYVNEANYNSDYVKETILDRVSKFISFFEMFINDSNIKEALLKGDKDRKIFKKYEKEFLGIENKDEYLIY
jgi:hypothetical protein